MSISRRQFLQTLAIAAAAQTLSPTMKLIADTTEPVDHLEAFLTAMDTPYAAPLNLHFENVLRNQYVGLILYDVKNQHLLTALSPEKQLPVASAFKAPLLMYFVDVVDPDIWGRIPVKYWNATASHELPEDLRNFWIKHHVVLRDLYQTLVWSDNNTTGAILSYVAKAQDRTDAIAAFNDWSRQRVGISQLSGLTAWSSGVVEGMTFVDERYENRTTTIHSQLVQLDNMMTTRDLGYFYMWMLTNLDAKQQQVCKDLLSTIYNNRGANLERLAQANSGISYSKNGSLDTDAGYAISDAGLIDLPDGRSYLLVMLSIDSDDEYGSIVPILFEELDFTLKGRYNELIHNHRSNTISSAELLAAYTSHLQIAYTQQNDNQSGTFRYGFIMPEGVQVYGSASENDILHNPIIKSTRFGVHLLMQGALIRYVDVNRNWVELVPDDHRDNVRQRLGTQIFLKHEDVWPIAFDYASAIPYIADENISHSDKFIIIDIVGRELIAFEAVTPVIRVPIVLNPDATPRGAQIITSKWFSRSMQPWAPGVPFTAFFGDDGFALHGSPWQRWSTTLNQENIYGRTSAGCVNVPDWMITSGEYSRPADELLFRWLGGMEHQDELVYDFPSEALPAIRIYSVDYLPNLNKYVRPDVLVNQSTTWDEIIAALDTFEAQAPYSFYL